MKRPCPECKSVDVVEMHAVDGGDDSFMHCNSCGHSWPVPAPPEQPKPFLQSMGDPVVDELVKRELLGLELTRPERVAKLRELAPYANEVLDNKSRSYVQAARVFASFLLEELEAIDKAMEGS